MIIVDCIQGSEEWDEIRRGKPTASCFDKILTPKTLKLSKQCVAYQLELIAQMLPGYSPPLPTFDMQRGSDLEPEAIAKYEFLNDIDVDRVGFVYGSEQRTWGGSPDGLIGTDGGLETKCPKASTHLEYMLEQQVPSKYLPQVWGCLLITGRQWWDWMSFHPELTPVIVRVERDEQFDKWSDAFVPAIETFLQQLNELKERLT